jgi:hypothetical protein
VCQRTKVDLTPSGRYTLSLIDDETFHEWFDKLSEERKPKFEGLKDQTYIGFPGYRPWVHFLLIPFRRILSAELFVVIARVGGRGNDEHFVDEKVTFSPKFPGELFLFANNEVIGIPGLYDLFYVQPGSVKVLVRREADKS